MIVNDEKDGGHFLVNEEFLRKSRGSLRRYAEFIDNAVKSNTCLIRNFRKAVVNFLA